MIPSAHFYPVNHYCGDYASPPPVNMHRLDPQPQTIALTQVPTDSARRIAALKECFVKNIFNVYFL